jgi:adenylate kinase
MSTSSPRTRTAPRRPVALTGTPGTGKSSVTRRLSGLRAVEVANLASAWGLARRCAGGLEVDLAGLQRRGRRRGAFGKVDVVVGHLAHLLPLRDVIVLRCRPDELDRRLRRARRGSPAERRENVEAEATDVVLLEAIRPGRRIWEVDSTGRHLTDVTRDVERRIRRRGPSDYGTVDWLADPRVTAHLLDREP